MPIGDRSKSTLAIVARLSGAQALTNEAKAEPFDMIISHGPLATAWTDAVLHPRDLAGKQRPHRAIQPRP